MASSSPSFFQFGVVAITPPAPLPFLAQPPTATPVHVVKHLADTTAAGSYTTATSQSESCGNSCSESSPAGDVCMSASRWTDERTPLGRPKVTTILCSDFARVQLPTDVTSPLESNKNNEEEDDEESGSILNHEDSFYASLMTAQQLRRQRDFTTRTSSSAAPSSAFTSTGESTQQSDAVTGGPLSARSRPSGAPSAAMGASASSLEASQAPRTLQDLLAWRQDMLEERMKEHAQRQEQFQSSTFDNRSFASCKSRKAGFQSPPMLYPKPVAPPPLSLETQQSSFAPVSARSPTAQGGQENEETTLSGTPQRAAWLRGDSHCTATQSRRRGQLTCVHSSAAGLEYSRPTPILSPQLTPTSAPTYSPSARTRHAMLRAMVLGEETALVRARSGENYMRAGDDEAHHSFYGCMGVVLLIVTLLFVALDFSLLSGGSTGLFF